MRRFSSESRVPCHEIGKGFDLARGFYDTHTGYGGGDLRQFTGHSDDQICLSNGKDRRHEEWKSQRDPTLDAELRERAIHQSLLTLQRFDQGVRKLQILFQRKATCANPLSGAHETKKV